MRLIYNIKMGLGKDSVKCKYKKLNIIFKQFSF